MIYADAAVSGVSAAAWVTVTSQPAEENQSWPTAISQTALVTIILEIKCI